MKKKKKVLANGRRKKKPVNIVKPTANLEAGKVSDYPVRASPGALEVVRELRKDVDRARGDAAAAMKNASSVRAELDQHKVRAAKVDVEYEGFAKEVVLRLEKLETAKPPIGRVGYEFGMDSKSPAEEAGEFSSDFKDAVTEAAASDDPTLRGSKWRHRALSWTEAKDGNFEEWAAARIEELWKAMKERIEWESDANHELRNITQKVRDEVRENVLKPPEGCEIVVRSSR